MLLVIRTELVAHGETEFRHNETKLLKTEDERLRRNAEIRLERHDLLQRPIGRRNPGRGDTGTDRETRHQKRRGEIREKPMLLQRLVQTDSKRRVKRRGP